ncbi:MAG TPA: cytochrome C [bacterium]|nr:cytochrome C [bacterium]
MLAAPARNGEKTPAPRARAGRGGWASRWRDRERATGLFGAAAALLLLSLLWPYWTIHLYAPQYPQGLAVSVYLTHAGGDVAEVDELNHYIGMAPLAEAAPVERAAGVFAAAVAALALLVVRFSGRRVPLVLAAPTILFPLIFTADLSYWLARYGHSLSPAAPIHMDAFTPVLLGQGMIAQFRTAAALGPGFYLAAAAAVLAIWATVLRLRTCRACVLRDRCSIVCLAPRASSAR